MEMKYLLVIVVLIAIIITIPFKANAFGLVTDAGSDIVEIPIEENKATFGFRVQNNEDEDITIKISMLEGQYIAEIRDNRESFTIKANTQKNPFYIDIELPKEREVGDKFRVGFEVKKITTGEEGKQVVFGQAYTKYFTVEVTTREKSYFWYYVAGIVVAIICIIVFLYYRYEPVEEEELVEDYNVAE